MALDAIALQKAVHSAGHTWIVRHPDPQPNITALGGCLRIPRRCRRR